MRPQALLASESMHAQLDAARPYKSMQKSAQAKKTKNNGNNRQPAGVTAIELQELRSLCEEIKRKQGRRKEGGGEIGLAHMTMLERHGFSPQE